MRSSTNEALILDQCNGKIKLITLYAVHFVLITKRCSMKKGVLRNFTKFTGKHLC